ncbi:hypothetical protein [Flavobacterium cutihirudinis]|nr:hypothetical protein [Flavobacterium cutihirudinis]
MSYQAKPLYIHKGFVDKTGIKLALGKAKKLPIFLQNVNHVDG